MMMTPTTYEISFCFAELHLPSAPTTTEDPPPAESDDEDDSDEESTDAAEGENLVPVEESVGSEPGDSGQSPDRSGQPRAHDDQLEQGSSSTRKPSATVHGGGGGVRHHDNKHRHGGSKGSGVRRSVHWPLVLVAVVMVTSLRWWSAIDGAAAVVFSSGPVAGSPR